MATPKPFSDKWWVVVSALMPSRVVAVDYDDAQRIADNGPRVGAVRFGPRERKIALTLCYALPHAIRLR